MRVEFCLVVVFVGLWLGLAGPGYAQEDALDLGDPIELDAEDARKNARAMDDPDEFGSDGADQPWERPPPDEEAPPPVAEVQLDKPTNPPDGRRIQAGIAVAYGVETVKPTQGVNAYGLGLGVRGGYTFEGGLFTGLASTYYFGGTVPEGQVAGVATAGSSVSAWNIGGEIGYDVWLGPVLFRPSAELGVLLTLTGDDAATVGGRTLFGTYLAPGASVLFPFSEMFYVGGDVRMPIPFGDGDGTLALSVTGGVRLLEL